MRAGYFKHTAKTVFLSWLFLCTTSAGFAQSGITLGFPQWPFILKHHTGSAAVRDQVVDFRPAYNATATTGDAAGVSNTPLGTSTATAHSGAAFDDCGNMVFYLNHTGQYATSASGSGNQMKIHLPSGVELTNTENRLDAAPRDAEVQVVKLPDFAARWMIIYNRNFELGSNGIYQYSELMYSVVEVNSGVLSFISDGSGSIYNRRLRPTVFYDFGKAVSKTYTINVSGVNKKVKYLYVRRNENNGRLPTSDSEFMVDQFKISGNGFLLNSGSPVFASKQIVKHYANTYHEDVGWPIELNEHSATNIKLATSLYYYGGNNMAEPGQGSNIWIAFMNGHENFGSSSTELIQCGLLGIIPPATADFFNNYSTASLGMPAKYYTTKNFDGSPLSERASYLVNFARKLANIEFSPSGQYLYVTGGGYVAGGYSHISYLGQIDVSSSSAPFISNTDNNLVRGIRLNVQQVDGHLFTLPPPCSSDYCVYGAADVFDFAASLNWQATSFIEKAPDGRLYFSKYTDNVLYCIEQPNNVLTVNLLPDNLMAGNANNITLLLTTSSGSPASDQADGNNLPDAVDQEVYYAVDPACITAKGCEDCIGSFSPEEGKYILSAWVNEVNATAWQAKTTFTNPQLYVDYMNAGGGTISSQGPFSASGQIIDAWQRVEGNFTIPAGTATIKLRLKCVTGDCYFDDIRIFPTDGSMKSYVYDPVTLRLMAELDERNYATFYEYDEEGKLMRIKKETEKGIMTIQESKSSLKKQ